MNNNINMEIKIEVSYEISGVKYHDDLKMDTNTYDTYAYPEDMINAEIWRLRENIKKAIKNHNP